MEKLQFDSFYKFLVSLGVGLFVVPFFFVNQMLSGKYDLLISQEEYDDLSTYSINTLNFRDKVYIFASNHQTLIIIACCILFAFSIALIIFGLIRWYKNQKCLDAQTRYQTKKMKIESEMVASSSENFLNRINTMDSSSKSEPVIEIAKIRDAFFCYLKNEYNSKEYMIYREMTIGKYYFDYIVAYIGNRFWKRDFLIEVKIIESAPKSLQQIKSALSSINDKLKEFNNCTNDTLTPILYLIDINDAKSDQDFIDNIKALQKDAKIKIKVLPVKILEKYKK